MILAVFTFNETAQFHYSSALPFSTQVYVQCMQCTLCCTSASRAWSLIRAWSPSVQAFFIGSSTPRSCASDHVPQCQLEAAHIQLRIPEQRLSKSCVAHALLIPRREETSGRPFAEHRFILDHVKNEYHGGRTTASALSAPQRDQTPRIRGAPRII